MNIHSETLRKEIDLVSTTTIDKSGVICTSHVYVEIGAIVQCTVQNIHDTF